MKLWKQRIAATVVGILIGGALMAGAGKLVPGADIMKPVAGAQVLSSARDTYVVEAVRKVGPAVVGISNKAYARDNFAQRVLIEKGAGSGVIFDANGYIATNFHVVEGAQQIVVSLADGRTVGGKVLGADQATDLAVVKIDVTGLPTAEFGDSDTLAAGEPAIAIGNPLGLEFSGSVTVGVISALGRTIEVGDRRFKLIQTDAAINPGNSGGALVSADGRLVGINSAKIAAAGVEGMGFAIPINAARPILQTLVEKGKVSRAYLGVAVLDPNAAARLGYDLQLDAGVYVARVEKDGPAYRSDIREGDVILKINGSDINSVADLRSVLDNVPVGAQVTVILSRGGRSLTVTPTVSEMP
jgi:serine protease Do